jgi:hypothetical protein
MIHKFPSQESYWVQTVPLNIVERAIAHSPCFGPYEAERQVGFTAPRHAEVFMERHDPTIYLHAR